MAATKLVENENFTSNKKVLGKDHQHIPVERSPFTPEEPVVLTVHFLKAIEFHEEDALQKGLRNYNSRKAKGPICRYRIQVVSKSILVRAIPGSHKPTEETVNDALDAIGISPEVESHEQFTAKRARQTAKAQSTALSKKRAKSGQAPTSRSATPPTPATVVARKSAVQKRKPNTTKPAPGASKLH